MTVTAVLASGAMVEVIDGDRRRKRSSERRPADLERALAAGESHRAPTAIDPNWPPIRILREAGLNVVRYDTADRFDYAETIIIDRDGKEYSVAALAEYFQVPPERIQRSGDLQSDADVVVILGRDFAQRAARE